MVREERMRGWWGEGGVREGQFLPYVLFGLLTRVATSVCTAPDHGTHAAAHDAADGGEWKGGREEEGKWAGRGGLFLPT
jgi:hypothetical protein